MLHLKIEVSGATEQDLEEAMEEVRLSLDRGNTCGFDRSPTGRYFFEVTGESEADPVEID